MKANELRLGNYVNYQGRAQKVHSLNMNQIRLGELAYDDYNASVSKDDIKPIPLTFEDFISIDEEDFLAGKTGFVILKNSYSYQFVYEDYKYMHLLQNLYFALTNKELTIK